MFLGLSEITNELDGSNMLLRFSFASCFDLGHVTKIIKRVAPRAIITIHAADSICNIEARLPESPVNQRQFKAIKKALEDIQASRFE